MKRSVLSVIAGLITAVITFVIVEKVNDLLHPFPANFDFKNSEAVADYFGSQPLLYWMMVLLGYILGSLLCGFFIKYIKKEDKKKLPIIAGSILTLSAVSNFMLIPHPTWFIVLALIIFIPVTLLGHSLYKLNSNG